MTERTYTTEQAARRLGVPANTIAKWKARGRVMPADWIQSRGRHHRDIPLYLLEDLQELARAWRERAATRRRNSR